MPGQPTIFDSLLSPSVGEDIYTLAADLYPICRSITGNGVRETLRVMGRHIPLSVREIPTGTQVFDWTIPREWNIRNAYIKTSAGDRIVDFTRHNLHVLNYSAPVRARLSLAELQAHLFSLPEEPDLIPYRTSYYKEQWGFCLPHSQRAALKEDTYEVVIDSELKDGALTWGEHVHRGSSDEEVLLTAHVCHPSLANDNCSGLALLTHLAKHLAGLETRYSYRFLFAPGTIGSIAWLASNEETATRIRHGLVLSCVGDGGGPTYKRSRRGNAVIDRAMAHVLAYSGLEATLIDFSPYGYDERQFCSPGFNLPVGLFQRSQLGRFREYHTSADNLDFISAAHLAQSYRLIVSVIDVLESNRTLVNLNPKCEPQLGRRSLYDAIGGDKEAPDRNMAMLWVLNLSDGGHSLLDIAERSGLPFRDVSGAADRLEAAQLLRPLSATVG